MSILQVTERELQLQRELDEERRINSIGSEREYILLGKIARLEKELDSLKLNEDPVGYIAWKDGEPCWSEDCVCQDPVYPADEYDDRTSMPVYTRPSNLIAYVQQLEDETTPAFIAQRNALKQALEVLYLKNNAGLPTYDSMVNQTIIAIRKALYETQS